MRGGLCKYFLTFLNKFLNKYIYFSNDAIIIFYNIFYDVYYGLYIYIYIFCPLRYLLINVFNILYAVGLNSLYIQYIHD